MNFYRRTKASRAAPLIKPLRSVHGGSWMSAGDLWAMPVHPDVPGCFRGWATSCSWFVWELLLTQIFMIHSSHGEWLQLAPSVAQPCSIYSPKPLIIVSWKNYVSSDDDLHFLIWYCNLFSTASYYQNVKFVQINIRSPLPFLGALKAWVIYQWPNVIAFSTIWLSKRKSDLDVCSEWFNLCRSNGSGKGGGGKVGIWRLNSSWVMNNRWLTWEYFLLDLN